MSTNLLRDLALSSRQCPMAFMCRPIAARAVVCPCRGQAPASLGVVENASRPIALPAAVHPGGVNGASVPGGASSLSEGPPIRVGPGPIVDSGRLPKESHD